MIKTDYIWAIYDLAEKLCEDVVKYVKSKGGFVDCQDGVIGSGDTIYAFNCYGGSSGNEVEEQFVYAVRVDDEDELYACLVPCSRTFREEWTREDYDKSFEGIDHDTHWHWINRNTDSVLFVQTIMNIAEFIEEYGE